MILIGKFTEAQLAAGEDKAACARARAEHGDMAKYVVPKFRRRNGKTVMELYGMDTNEYCNSSFV